MKLLVTGGRDFAKKEAAFYALDMIHSRTPISVIINGGCRGADALAVAWAIYRNVRVETYHAEWLKHSASAVPVRNQRMIDEGYPDAYLAMPGGRGTADCIRRCLRANVPSAWPPISDS